MLAVRFHNYGPPSVLVVEDVERPEPKEGEALVRVRAAGVNAIDWKYRAGYLKELVESGSLTPQLGPVFPLADAAQAHAVAESGHGRGRIVLQVST
jgi:NADPH:quinone reductase-like Zn-dependent oxidoreductase